MKILTLLVAVFFSSQAFAMQDYEIVIKNHKFIPDVIEVPARQKFRLIVDNQDDTAEEFESHDLLKEKIIGGNKKAIMIIRPLEKGEYSFVGEFHPKTAQGVIIAK